MGIIACRGDEIKRRVYEQPRKMPECDFRLEVSTLFLSRIHSVTLHPLLTLIMSLQQPCRRVTHKTIRMLERRPAYLTLRCFSTTPQRRTDGVFRELTEQRVRVPWVQALRQQQKGGHDRTLGTDSPQTPKDRDLTPKRMKDSYHAVVRACRCIDASSH